MDTQTPHLPPAGLHAAFTTLRENLAAAIVGQSALVERLLIALLADGHLLVEGAPGLAKTTAIRTLAAHLEADFARVQFTPDLLPADLTGTEVWRPQEGRFEFQPGPVFHPLLLADEINRAPAKVQSALLEAMGERQVTVGRHTYALPQLFLVMATQNPIEQEGTYPLPEAQLDRFLFKLLVPYPSAAEEAKIVATFGRHAGPPRPADMGVSQVADGASIRAAARAVKGITLSDSVIDYVVRLVRATRDSADLSSGASPRAAVLLANAARARAALEARDYVLPDDVKALAAPVLRHRLLLSPAAEIEGKQVEALVAELVEATEAPR